MHLSSCFERVIKSVSAIRNAFNSQSFNFSKVSVDNVLKKLTNYVIQGEYRALTFL